MIPHTTSIDILFILRDMISMNPREMRDPTKDEIIMTAEVAGLRFSAAAIITIAVVSFAPEETPSTKGPEIGLLKKVCRRYPERESAPPSIKADNVLGMRIFHIILAFVSAVFPEKIICIASENEIPALPIKILNPAVSSISIIRKINEHKVLFFVFII